MKVCQTCPWRKSTPKRGFPGGYLDAPRLRAMAAGEPGTAMACHSTPAEAPHACIGFAAVVGFNSVGLRLAAMVGAYDPTQNEVDAPLHTLAGVLRTHGSEHPTPCKVEAPCKGCTRSCPNLHQGSVMPNPPDLQWQSRRLVLPERDTPKDRAAADAYRKQDARRGFTTKPCCCGTPTTHRRRRCKNPGCDNLYDPKCCGDETECGICYRESADLRALLTPRIRTGE